MKKRKELIIVFFVGNKLFIFFGMFGVKRDVYGEGVF